MRELVGGKNTIDRTAAVLKKPHKVTFTFTFNQSMISQAINLPEICLISFAILDKY